MGGVKMQKILGAVLVLIGISSMVMFKDATSAFVVIPIGIYAIATKENIMGKDE
jgi:hypothetical protein